MWLGQDYEGKKELIILNDDPTVAYFCRHPDVRAYNWECRFDNVRYKANICVSFCSGDILFGVADDDAYAPWTTSLIVECIGDDPFIAFNGFWKIRSGDNLTWLGTGIKWEEGGIAALYACTPELYKLMGGRKHWAWIFDKDENCYRWVIHPENFRSRVEGTRFYKEFDCDMTNAFFTWDRTSNREIWDVDEEEFKIKRRIREKITLEV